MYYNYGTTSRWRAPSPPLSSRRGRRRVTAPEPGRSPCHRGPRHLLRVRVKVRLLGSGFGFGFGLGLCLGLGSTTTAPDRMSESRSSFKLSGSMSWWYCPSPKGCSSAEAEACKRSCRRSPAAEALTLSGPFRLNGVEAAGQKHASSMMWFRCGWEWPNKTRGRQGSNSVVIQRQL